MSSSITSTSGVGIISTTHFIRPATHFIRPITTPAILDGDTSTEGSSSPDLILASNSTTPNSTTAIVGQPPVLNVNAPAFTSISSMTPVIITKNVDIGNERWKPSATIVEENINTLPVADVLPQPFIGADGIYYWPAEVVNNFPQTVLVEPAPPTTTIVNGHDPPTSFPQPSGGTDLLNNLMQKDNLPPGDGQPDDLKRLIQLQFEYYFSRENLANDSYLVSQMDGDQYVPISTVAKFNQIRKLTSDMNLIVEALKESPYVQLDESEEKVRANMKRCIVILREIPESTPMEEVKALFAHPNCPQWTSFEFAHNDSWYVTFDCEEDAKKAYRHLREEVQSFKGRPLMARIKAKTLLSRTVYLPKRSSQSNSTTTDTITTETTTTQFTPAPPPIGPFAVPANAVFHQPQTFPFYAAAPLNGGPLIHGAWIGPRPNGQFLPPEIRPKNNSYNKHNGYIPNKMNGQRSYYSNKPRAPFRNNNYNNSHPKIPFHERNGFADGEEKIHSFRKSHNSNSSNSNTTLSHNSYNRKDDTRNARNSNHKKDPRGNIEESPRFQRLRERRTKDDLLQTKSLDINSGGSSDGMSTSSQDLNLDLAIENFPALPSPNSPNESFKTASSLKELAATALELSQTKSSMSKESSPTSISDLSDASLSESASTNSETKSTSSSASSTNGSTSSSSGYRSAPKMSYAEMAQKPNKNSSGNFFDGDDNDLSNENISTEIKIIPVNNEPVKNENKNNHSKTSPRRNSKSGSPRTSRHRNNQDNKNNEQKSEQKNNENKNGNQQTVVVKETYASKFGKAPSLTKSNSAPPFRTSNNVPKTFSSSLTNNSSSRNNSGGSEKNLNNLPSPKPLMSQIIKPPENKLNEIVNQQQQHKNKQKSFSETIRNTENTENKDLDIDNKEIVKELQE